MWLASSVAHFTLPQGFDSELDRTFNNWATPKSFYPSGGLIRAIDFPACIAPPEFLANRYSFAKFDLLETGI